MSQPTAVFELEINDFILSVTTRFYPGDSLQLLDDLTANTISAWLWIVGLLEKNEWDTSVAIDSVEEKYAKTNNLPYEPPLGDARVTVWATWRSNNNFKFHLNSDEKIQDAVLVNTASRAGIQKATDKWLEKHPQNQATKPSNSSFMPPQATTTSKAPENAQKATNEALQHNHDAKCYTRKEALDEFEAGAEFSMQICKIMKRSQDGNEYYEFYHKYGQNPGKFAELRLYADNEVALKNGLMDSLDALALKPGQDRLGEWLLKCRVAENAKKGENVVYPLALSN